MGYQMAGNVRKKMQASATLHIFDVTVAACQRLLENFSSFGPILIAKSSKEVAERSQTVISMIPSGHNARQVYLDAESGVIAASKNANRLILECSTIEAIVTREIGNAVMDAGSGIYVDSPVSGGVAGAEVASLSFFAGTSRDKVSDPTGRRIWEIICYMGASERVTFCGQLGSGLVCKIVNNYIGLSNIVTAAEGMAFGLKHGVDRQTLYKCIKGSSGDSWVMDFAQPVPGIHAKSASSNDFRPTFTPRLCVKDVSLAIKAAQEAGINATMGETALKIYKQTDDDSRTTVSISCRYP